MAWGGILTLLILGPLCVAGVILCFRIEEPAGLIYVLGVAIGV